MQLSKNQKDFFEFFAQFLKSTSNFKHFEKKMTLIAHVFLKLETAQDLISRMSLTTVAYA